MAPRPRALAAPALVAACATALLLPTGPATADASLAKAVALRSTVAAVTTPGWTPQAPPMFPTLLEANLNRMTYAATCGGQGATAWSVAAEDDSVGPWDTTLVSTSGVVGDCLYGPGPLSVRQGSQPLDAKAYNSDANAGAGTILATGDAPSIDFGGVPMPRQDQWLGVAARSEGGEPLPMLVRRVASVSSSTFTVDQPIDSGYLGGVVVDNQGRPLGMVTAAGITVMGTPQLCSTLFLCREPTHVWWDITAPSAVTNAKAVGVKGAVIVTWQAAASDGGSEVAYWYVVGAASAKKATTTTGTFRVRIPATRGSRVTVRLDTINDAGPGPSVTVSARAK